MGRDFTPEEARELQRASAKARVQNRARHDAIVELVRDRTIPIPYSDLTPAQQALVDALIALRQERGR